ncbi:DUF3316 domain-containing protein [Psychromonas sp. PT13]|uniref:DUF3316 domain-containing protein n=1 Tax=Psychromonas sp. PT13 TaxID=3439547 RepID=UPI003EBEFC14
MKKITTVLLGASAIMLSASSFANVGSQTFKTETVDSKDAAYSLGLGQLQQLKSETGYQLSHDLSTPADTYKEKNSIELNDGAYVTVQESMNEQGDIVYNGLVNVTYHYVDDHNHQD